MAQQNTTEEVDLGYMFKSIGYFFKNIVKLLFRAISFIKKYILIIVGIVILGVIIGYFLDKNSKKVYENRIIVIPNFESVEYLYDITDELNFKINIKDSIFLKEIFGKQYKNLRKIEIEPIIDIYNFTTKSRENIDVFRILFENQDMKEFVDDMTTSKQYKYQKLKVYTIGKNSKGLLNDLFDYFNENEHFKQYQEVYIQNTKERIAEADKTIKQADSVIYAIASAPNNQNSNAPVYASYNNDFFKVIQYKEEILQYKLELLKKSKDEVAIIKPVSINYNIIEGGFASLKGVIKIPVLLLFIFFFLATIRFIYKYLKSVAQE